MSVVARCLGALVAAGALCAAAGSTLAEEMPPGTERATFGGGCFWCMEPPYDELDGVLSTRSGFMGGDVADPSYEEVVAGGTGHTEVVQVVFDPERVGYGELLEVYWRNIDPLDGEGQFCDRGETYRPVIFTHGAAQREQALASRARLADSKRFDAPIAVEIEEAGVFYAAEAYHQGYYRKNPIRYRVYRSACGRDRRLRELWDGDR